MVNKGCKDADFFPIHFGRKNKEIAACIFFSSPDDVVKNRLTTTHS